MLGRQISMQIPYTHKDHHATIAYKTQKFRHKIVCSCVFLSFLWWPMFFITVPLWWMSASDLERSSSELFDVVYKSNVYCSICKRNHKSEIRSLC